MISSLPFIMPAYSIGFLCICICIMLLLVTPICPGPEVVFPPIILKLLYYLSNQKMIKTTHKMDKMFDQFITNSEFAVSVKHKRSHSFSAHEFLNFFSEFEFLWIFLGYLLWIELVTLSSSTDLISTWTIARYSLLDSKPLLEAILGSIHHGCVGLNPIHS